MRSPAEGFLLSRIDGATSWGLLREIGGLAPSEVDACLERWLAEGVITCAEPQALPGNQKPSRPARPGEIDASLLDDSLDLEIATQRRILDFESRLSEKDHELLGVEPDADAKTVKRAYFALSKEFHPDRYFRRSIGDYSQRLHEIFKRILDAYEMLSDPQLRAEVEKSRSMAAAAGETTPPVQADPGPGGVAQEARELTPIERLRARMPFKLPASVLIERQQRAQEFYRASCKALVTGQFTDAAAHRRLAIAFDPFCEEYREDFADIQASAAEARAEALMAQLASEDSLVAGLRDPEKEALRLYEEALLYRPLDASLNAKAASCALAGDQADAAFEYAQTAVEQNPESADNRCILARAYAARKDRGHAIHELEEALALDAKHRDARALLARLRRPLEAAAREG